MLLSLEQRYYWHRCPTDFVLYLHEFEAIFEKAVTSESGTQMGLFDLKTSGQKSRDLFKYDSIKDVDRTRVQIRLTY
jgi:hypothetical protein